MRTKDPKDNGIRLRSYSGEERGETFLCVQLSGCFGSREGRQASAAVPEEQLVSSWVLHPTKNVTDTGTC